MANNDRIYEAYMGNMGDNFKDQTRARIDWILSQVKGKENVLDVGCSQGIVSILCAEQGSNVTGVEIQQENVDYAQNLVKEKYAQLQEKVQFIQCDFMQWDCDKKYDAIVLTEVIEHLPNCEEFLKKAATLLCENGVIVVTTPFGYCNHPDHVRTFFLSSFMEIMSVAFSVQEVHYGGKWIGCVASAGNAANKELTYEDFKQEEEQFFIIHKELSDRVTELYNNLQNANKKYREACGSIQQLKENQIKTDEVLAKASENGLDYACEMLVKCSETNQENLKALTNAKKTIQKQQREIVLLRQEVKLQQNRWNRLENIGIFKVALKIYRKIRRS